MSSCKAPNGPKTPSPGEKLAPRLKEDIALEGFEPFRQTPLYNAFNELKELWSTRRSITKKGAYERLEKGFLRIVKTKQGDSFAAEIEDSSTAKRVIE